MDTILFIILLPICGVIFVVVGIFIRVAVFKEDLKKSSFGSGVKSFIIGLVFCGIASIAFKGCYRNIDNDPTIDYDGK
jgi:hypothetical protein